MVIITQKQRKGEKRKRKLVAIAVFICYMDRPKRGREKNEWPLLLDCLHGHGSMYAHRAAWVGAAWWLYTYHIGVHHTPTIEIVREQTCRLYGVYTTVHVVHVCFHICQAPGLILCYWIEANLWFIQINSFKIGGKIRGIAPSSLWLRTPLLTKKVSKLFWLL